MRTAEQRCLCGGDDECGHNSARACARCGRDGVPRGEAKMKNKQNPAIASSCVHRTRRAPNSTLLLFRSKLRARCCIRLQIAERILDPGEEVLQQRAVPEDARNVAHPGAE